MITSERVRSLAGELVTDELVVLPVRHHSPACALQVRQVIAERRPSVVLVEGPRDFTGLIPLLTHEAAQMPLAVYSYARHGAGEEQARWSGYYPFCDYSPEARRAQRCCTTWHSGQVHRSDAGRTTPRHP